MALSAYRTLLRSTRIAFQHDMHTLLAARQNARTGFEQHRNLTPESEESAKRIHYANDVARILRENVLQGTPVAGKEGQYRLRIHEHTELGDNDSIKTAGKGMAAAGSKCCSS